MSNLLVQNIKHTGGTTAMSVDSGGRVTQNQIPFLICNCVSHTTSISATADTLVPWKNVISSRGIILNASTNTWTVPVTGLYSISAAVRLNAEFTYLFWDLQDATGTLTAYQTGKLVLSHGNGAGFTTCLGTILAELETGKSYGTRMAGNNTSAVGLDDDQTWMDIHLVG